VHVPLISGIGEKQIKYRAKTMALKRTNLSFVKYIPTFIPLL
jgi:hypothetical protein